MHKMNLEMPEGGWARAISWTLITTLVVSVIATIGSVGTAYMTYGRFTSADIGFGAGLSIALCAPIVGSLSIKIQQLRLANERLHTFAITDSLTGWLNGAAFSEQAEARIRFAATHDIPHPGALMVIDVDSFKVINDTFGHQEGDEALRLISSALKSRLRSFDYFGRLGGEEFGIYLVDADANMATEIAERCRLAVSEIQFLPAGSHHRLSISIGVCVATNGTNFATLYRDADTKLYLAKTSGRNRVVAHLPDPRPQQIEQPQIADPSEARRRVA